MAITPQLRDMHKDNCTDLEAKKYNAAKKKSRYIFYQIKRITKAKRKRKGIHLLLDFI